MKKVLLMGLLALSATVKAQTTTVGFSVEIPTSVIFDSVDVTGDWVDTAGLGTNWSNGKKLALVTGNIYGVSVSLPSATYQFKFRTYSGGNVTWEQIPGACAVNTNRQMVLSGAIFAAGPVCLSSCALACPGVPVSVNLVCRVDMNGVNRTIPTGATEVDMVNVTGDFGADAGASDWTPGSLPMTEVYPGSKIYERTLAVKSKYYNYKFLRANDWDYSDSNNVKTQFSEQKDSFATNPCLNGDNRFIDLSIAAAGSTTVVYYKWQTCSAGKPLGITSNWIETIFTAQPNPFTGSTLIRFTNPGNEIYNLQVVNAMGQVVFTKSNIINNQQEISNLVPGIYTAILRNNAGAAISLRLSAQ
jgi:hypothetical protein